MVLPFVALHTPTIDTLMTPTLAEPTCINRLGEINGMNALHVERRAVLGRVISTTTFREVNPSLQVAFWTTGFIVKWMSLTFSHVFCWLFGRQRGAIDEHASRAGHPFLRVGSSNHTNIEGRIRSLYLPDSESEWLLHFFQSQLVRLV